MTWKTVTQSVAIDSREGIAVLAAVLKRFTFVCKSVVVVVAQSAIHVLLLTCVKMMPELISM